LLAATVVRWSPESPSKENPPPSHPADEAAVARCGVSTAKKITRTASSKLVFIFSYLSFRGLEGRVKRRRGRRVYANQADFSVGRRLIVQFFRKSGKTKVSPSIQSIHLCDGLVE
jgi:hypothetical protein